MSKVIKIIHDSVGETITVYFDNPENAEVCEETGEGIILIKDKENNIIGFEKMYFKLEDNVNPVFQLETNAARTITSDF
jgi:hypothetical protein